MYATQVMSSRLKTILLKRGTRVCARAALKGKTRAAQGERRLPGPAQGGLIR